MSNGTNNFWKGLGIIISIIAGIAILIGVATPEGWLRKWIAGQAPSSTPANGNTGRIITNGYSSSSRSAGNNSPDENKCVLRNAMGEEITITSESNNELFRRYCLSGYTQPYYYNLYWYYPVRWFRFGRWHGHHNGGTNGGNGGANGGNGGAM